MAAKRRIGKHNELRSGLKSKRGRHLIALRKNKAALIQKLKEDAPLATASCQTLITSTPSICRQRIQDSSTEIDCSNIDLLSSSSILNDLEDSLAEINCTETDSLLDHGYCTNNSNENQESSENEKSRENTTTESTNILSHATENEKLSNNEGTNETTIPELTIMQCDESEESVTDFKNGSRIIDIMFYEEQMVQMNEHNSPSNCNFSHMQLVNENRSGISFVRTFKCSMCEVTKKMYSHRYLQLMPNHKKSSAETEPVEMNINEAAVAGTLLAGIGETALNRVLSALNIPTMSSATFSKFREKVATHLEKVAKDTMYKSVMKARKIAIARGDVDEFGFALVPVVVDGAWCQRTYRNTYNSTGGCGVIIAADTQEVLYVGIKNKYCVICAKAKNKQVEPKKHTCHQNWGENRSSASMKAAAIVEGFLLSESMYKIRYHKMIADGDSSVYKMILDFHPYENLVVQKIECRNHLMRNFCSNITADCLTSSERNKEKCKLKSYVLQKLPKLRCGIRKSIDHWSAKGVNALSRKGLQHDLVNAPSHVFGEHAKCEEIGYFCDGKPKEDETNMVPQLKKHGIYQLVMEHIDRLATNANSLLHNVTNNAVEAFNAVIASKISGKRVNYTARDSYKARIHYAVLSLAGEPFRMVHKKSSKMSPGLYSKLLEQRTLHKRIGQTKYKKTRKQLFRKNNNGEEDYGSAAAAPDLDASELQSAIERRIERIKENHSDIDQIELNTRGQSESSLWHEIRRNAITASHVGSICKMRKTTSMSSNVTSILYSWFDNDDMKWGRDHEKDAIAAVEEYFNLEIVQCGIFIHPKHYFIGASPDGLVGDDGIIEVKCPSKARDLSVGDAVSKGFISCLERETLELKKTSNYYYQVQTQLEVTGRHFCLFVVWTTVDWVVQSISRDKEFWSQKMPKIESFYKKSLLPELVDSRKRRSLPLRSINIDGIDINTLPSIKKKAMPKKEKTSASSKPPTSVSSEPSTSVSSEPPTSVSSEPSTSPFSEPSSSASSKPSLSAPKKIVKRKKPSQKAVKENISPVESKNAKKRKKLTNYPAADSNLVAPTFSDTSNVEIPLNSSPVNLLSCKPLSIRNKIDINTLPAIKKKAQPKKKKTSPSSELPTSVSSEPPTSVSSEPSTSPFSEPASSASSKPSLPAPKKIVKRKTPSQKAVKENISPVESKNAKKWKNLTNYPAADSNLVAPTFSDTSNGEIPLNSSPVNLLSCKPLSIRNKN